jgi:hypothetical protein
MVVTEYNNPWKHIVIDDFLDNETFAWLTAYVKKPKKHLIKPANGSKVVRDNYPAGVESELFDKLSPFLFRIKDEYFDKLNYANKSIPKNFYPHFQINFCSSNFKYPTIHPDDGKLLTIVLYVYPNDSDGTEIYSNNSEDSFVKQVAWLPNRALCFVPQNDPKFTQTWHNYKNTKSDIRITVNLTLETKIEVR